MARAQRKLTGVNDFTGGLNLGPPQEIAVNEVAFARDVVFSSRGGVATRPGFRPFSGIQLAGDSDQIQVLTHVHYRQADSTYQLFATAVNSGVVYWTEGDQWFSTGMDAGSTIVGTESATRFVVGMNGAQYLDRSYFVKTDAVAGVMWDGYTATTLGTGWNNDLADATVQNMPPAYMVAVKGDFAFVAVTFENSTIQRNRLRWSHPGIPTAWREEDYVDIPQPITAIVPFRDFLAVFTNESIYGLYGDSTETFQLQEISSTSGTPFHWCVTTSASTMYWWDWDQGVMAMGAGAPRPVMGKIKPFFDRGGFIPDRYVSRDAVYPPPNLLWGEGKLYVRSGGPLNPTVHPTGLGELFVYDPDIGREGAWTTFTAGDDLGGMANYPRATKNDLVVAGSVMHPMVLNDYSQVLDRNFQYDTTDKRPPSAVVRTAPFEGENNVTKKRWSRPRVTIRSSSTRQHIEFGYLKNYFEGNPATMNDIDLNFLALAADPAAVWVGDTWQDLFPSIDTARWNAAGGGVTAAGDLAMQVTAAGATQTLTTDIPYDVRDVGISAQLTAAPSGTATTSLIVFTTNENARWHVSGSNLIASWRDPVGAVTVLATIPFNATTTDWVRIREDSGQLVYEYGADGSTWTVATSLSWPFVEATPDDAAWWIQFQATVPAAGTQTIRWDNFKFQPEGFGFIWDTDDWAELADNLGNGLPDNNVQFETLPSAGAGHVFQMEFRSVSTNGRAVDYRDTNGAWGIDSIVLPYREKGIR